MYVEKVCTNVCMYVCMGHGGQVVSVVDFGGNVRVGSNLV